MKVFEIKESISQEVRKIAIQNGWLQEDSKESTANPEMVNESENSETISLSEASENISENFETVNPDQKPNEIKLEDPVSEVEVVTVKALSEEIKRMKHLIDFRK